MATHHLTEEQYRALIARSDSTTEQVRALYDKVHDLSKANRLHAQFLRAKDLVEEFTAFVVADRMEK